MFPKGVGIKGRLIPFLACLAFTLFVTAIGNDVVAAYGGIVVFVAVYTAVIVHAERRGNALWLDRS